MARGFLALLGLASIFWAFVVLPKLWEQFSIEDVARRIIPGSKVEIETLARLEPALTAMEGAERCQPAAVRSGAIVRARLLEETMSAGTRSMIDPRMTAAREAIRLSLACSPADAFLWLAYYWIENMQSGFRIENLTYLQLSYRLGAQEGWIAVKRNPLALVVFEQLPPALAESAMMEFAGMVANGLYDEAADILIRSGWRLRDRLLLRLRDVAERHRRAFARVMHNRGDDVSVPGINPREQRPWE